MKIKLGLWWTVKDDLDPFTKRYGINDRAIFAQVDTRMYAFIMLSTGNRWTKPLHIERPINHGSEYDLDLTDDEWNIITTGHNFILG